MVSSVTARRIRYWSLFIMIWLIVLFVRLLPLDIRAGGWPGPNWTILFAFAWVLRRPNFVPVLLVAVPLFLDDMIFMRPPGLWAGLSIIGLEFLRSRAKYFRELPFLFEWAMVSGVIMSIVLANRLVSAVFVITQPNIFLDTGYLAITVAVYPLIVVISSQILGVRQSAPGEFDEIGHKL